MSTYIYRARDRYGKLVIGQIDAASLIAAEKNIENLKLIPLSVEEKSSISMSELMPSFQSISKKDIIIFSRQLATLYQSGVPISKSLTSLIEFTRNKKLKIILQEVKDDIESGQTLAKSLGKHPKIFSEIYVNMVEVGESTGLLYDVLV
ncbi:MAG: type II secretion system F family protein, partial [bacterium]